MRARTTTSIIAMALAAGLTTTSPAAAASSCAGANETLRTATAAELQRATLCLLNEERADAGLRPLRQHRRLEKAATGFSAAMVRQQFFDHVSPDGSTLTSRVKKVQYTKGARRWGLGENIAWGSDTASTPAAIVDAWMHSSGHKANILSSTFTEIGIGIVAGAPVARAASGTAGLTYTTDFGFRG